MRNIVCYHPRVRRFIILIAGICLVASLTKDARALTDEEKKELFLKAREEMQTVPAGEEPSPTPKPKPKPKTSSKNPSRTPTPKPSSTPAEAPKATPEPTKPEPVPAPKPHPEHGASPAPTPPPPAAPVVIEKSGLENNQGLEPPPPPPPSGGFFGFFRTQEYKYLTRQVREAIDRAPVQRHRWKYIVVHNSGTRQGNAKIFDYYHRNVRKMPNGLAYQFVIGNGTSSGNGQIEVGDRWRRQINGGHVHSDYLNNIALGICLVGDFNRDLPTKEQLAALDELIRYLRIRVGRIDGKPAIVKAHKEINPPQWPTDCPGDRFPYHWLHSQYD